VSSIRKNYKDVKKVLHKHDLTSFFNLSKYGFSPYRACEHGCLYCDGRAEKYYVEGEFDKDIIIRRNLPEILDLELSKIREKGFVCIGSGVSDPYQPVEEDELIMRKCAEILHKHSVPVVVMTKSALVLRDLDIWGEINRKSGFLLMMSCTWNNDEMRKKIEPHASSVEERISALTDFKDSGCFTGVLAMPFLPLISETEENMFQIAKMCKDSKVDFMMPGGLTLRPGVQKDIFFKHLTSHYPEYVSTYEKIYGENRQSGAPSAFWYDKMSFLYTKMSELSGVSSVIPHYIYRNKVAIFDEIFLILTTMKIIYDFKGITTSRLSKAISKYSEWIITEKKAINRSKKRRYEELDQLLMYMCQKNSMDTIIQNEKVSELIKKVVVERAVFNGVTGRLHQIAD
jgi:DNA repair photolyase